MRSRTLAKITLPLLGFVVLGFAPAVAQQSLTYEQARTAMDAAERDARSNQWNLTIVIADAQGVPIYVRRMDGASSRTFDVAIRKVRTALAAGMATGDYGQALAAGRVEEIPDGVTFEGGYPIRLGGNMVGAMSASGASGAQDAQVVRAGMAAIGVEP